MAEEKRGICFTKLMNMSAERREEIPCDTGIDLRVCVHVPRTFWGTTLHSISQMHSVHVRCSHFYMHYRVMRCMYTLEITCQCPAC